MTENAITHDKSTRGVLFSLFGFSSVDLKKKVGNNIILIIKRRSKGTLLHLHLLACPPSWGAVESTWLCLVMLEKVLGLHPHAFFLAEVAWPRRLPWPSVDLSFRHSLQQVSSISTWV